MQSMTTTQDMTHAQELVALRFGRPVADLLRELHDGRAMSQGAIADELGISRQTVGLWLRECGIATRRPGRRPTA